MSTSWIDETLKLKLLSGLNKKTEALGLQFARIEEHPTGHVFVHQGEYTEDFYVVLRGGVTAYHVAPEGDTRILTTLGRGDWFGDVSALSNQPSQGTLKADTMCILVVLEPATITTQGMAAARGFDAELSPHLTRPPKPHGSQALPRLS